MPTGKDLIRKGAKEASGADYRPKYAGKMAEGVVCEGGQVWDQKLGKCVKSVAPSSTLKKVSKALESAPIPKK